VYLSREVPIRNVVVMGMGEPFLNYEAVMRAIHILSESEGLQIGSRRITVSTAGMVPEIYRFAEEHSQVNLAISLNAPDDAARKKIMPIARYYSIDRLMKACHFYTKTTHRRLTFEYVLLREINDKPKHAEELAKLVKGDLFHVNLIAHNPVKGSGPKAPEKHRVEQFMRTLTDRGVTVTLRRSPGQSIDAACGQLTAKDARTRARKEDA
jgi:23S rRNA (adenine2503-C2)-methyltransferase